MFGLIFKNNAINNINASITFFMPSPPSHTIVATQAKSDRGDVDLGPKKIFRDDSLDPYVEHQHNEVPWRSQYGILISFKKVCLVPANKARVSRGDMIASNTRRTSILCEVPYLKKP